MNHLYLHSGIILLTLLTALAHLAIGITGQDNLLVMNGLGYVALLVALYVPFTPMRNFRVWFRHALIVYTVITIIGYFALHDGIPTVHAHSESESVESREPIELQEGVKYEETNAIDTDLVIVETRLDYLGLGVKGVEVVLLGFLSVDAYVDRRRRKLSVVQMNASNHSDE